MGLLKLQDALKTIIIDQSEDILNDSRKYASNYNLSKSVLEMAFTVFYDCNLIKLINAVKLSFKEKLYKLGSIDDQTASLSATGTLREAAQ